MKMLMISLYSVTVQSIEKQNEVEIVRYGLRIGKVKYNEKRSTKTDKLTGAKDIVLVVHLILGVLTSHNQLGMVGQIEGE